MSSAALKRLTPRRLAALGVGLAALGGCWIFLAPAALGGSTSYVITSGVSMQPRFHSGDLALVRPAGGYQVGDIVAYHSHQLHTVVLHRIVATSGDRYVFKGDNNSWRDPEHPTRDQLVGKLWLQLPVLGTRLAELRTPQTMAILAGLASVLLVGGAGVQNRRRRGRRRGRQGESHRIHTRPSIGDGAAQTALIASLSALAVCLALVIFVFARPTHQLTPATQAYTQSGVFSYTARAAAGAVYPDGHVSTGQPLFSRLVDRTRFRFVYAIRSRSATHVTGSAALNAEVTSTSGWTHTIQLEPPTPFSGLDVVVGGALELRRLQALLRRVETLTADSGGTYTLTLRPDIRAGGTLAGRQFTTTFTPQLPLTLDSLELRPSPNLDASLPPASAPAFHPTQHGSVSYSTPIAATLTFRQLRVPIEAARIAALTGAIASLCALLLSALLLFYARRADEPTRIQARYRDRIVTVGHSNLGGYTDLVDLPSIDALARLAERYDCIIIHEHTDLGHAYRITDNHTLYIYLIHHQQPRPNHPSRQLQPQPELR
ncbi:MAG: hypothetical protein QOJ31_2028 [Gaiellales bacterium]|nr:hypothetical protein [Gaiellales bacterium]